MSLQKHYVDIDQIIFDDCTAVRSHVLHINRQELQALLRDSAFSDVRIELASPGESCRLTNVCDVVQPVYKPEGSTFPGVIDPIQRAGQGSTVVLGGVAVAEVCEMAVPLGCLLDMSGPGALHSILPQKHIVALNPVPAAGTSGGDYFRAVNLASRKAAKYLAQAAAGCQPDRIESLEYPRLKDSSLPKVAYIFQIFSHAPLTDLTFYGSTCHDMLPVIVQPGELLDGALCNRNYYQLPNSDPTYLYQNHPMVLELLGRHGKDINFVGVIMTNAPAQAEDKKRNAMLAAGLAHDQLGAEGVIITKEGGGHPQIDLQMNCEMSAALGMKPVILISEFLSLSNSSDEVVIFRSDAADAMISSGCLQKLSLPAMDRVIGTTPILDAASTSYCDPNGAFIHENRYIRGSLSQLGGTRFTSLTY